MCARICLLSCALICLSLSALICVSSSSSSSTSPPQLVSYPFTPPHSLGSLAGIIFLNLCPHWWVVAVGAYKGRCLIHVFTLNPTIFPATTEPKWRLSDVVIHLQSHTPTKHAARILFPLGNVHLSHGQYLVVYSSCSSIFEKCIVVFQALLCKQMLSFFEERIWFSKPRLNFQTYRSLEYYSPLH